MRRKLRHWIAPVTALALMAPATAACEENFAAATIWYEQIGACNGVPTGSGAVTAGPDAAYIAFRINTIENTMENAREFSFDPNRLYINEDPRAFVSTSYGTTLANPFAALGQSVPAGTTAEVNGAVFAIVQHPDISGDTVARYNLYHDTPTGTQGAFVLARESTPESYPFRSGCQELTY